MAIVSNAGANPTGVNIGGVSGATPYYQVPTQASNNGANSVASYSTQAPAAASNGGVASYQAPVVNPNASLINQLNSQMGQLDNQQNVGLSNLQNSWQGSMNSLDQQNALAQNQYNTQNQQNTQSYLNNRNNIITNTNAQANALQRLLGINGAGNSSAAYDAVPYAASQYGSQNLNGAQTTYGNNASDLTNAWDQTEMNYGQGKDSLNQQLYAGQNGLKSSIAQTRASLLSELGQLQNTTQYDPQVSSLMGQITQLSNQYANPVLSAPNLSFSPSTLADYSLGQQTAAQNAPSAGQSEVNPTFLGMLSGQRDQYGNLVQA